MPSGIAGLLGVLVGLFTGSAAAFMPLARSNAAVTKVTHKTCVEIECWNARVDGYYGRYG